MTKRMLRLALEVQRRPEGVSHEEAHRIHEAEHLMFCDALLVVSIVFKPFPSMIYYSFDGRSPEGVLPPLEVFRVWAYMGGVLSQDIQLGESQRAICDFAWTTWNDDYCGDLPPEPKEPQPVHLFFGAEVHPHGIPYTELEQRDLYGADAMILAQITYPYKGMYFQSVNGMHAGDAVHPQLWWLSWVALTRHLLDLGTLPDKEQTLLRAIFHTFAERPTAVDRRPN